MVFPDDTIEDEQHSSIVWNKASNEDLQRYASLVFTQDLMNCLSLMMSCSVLIPFVRNTSLLWIVIVNQFATVLLSLPRCAFQLQLFVNVLPGGMFLHAR